MTNLNWRRFINEKLSGRKVNRWLTTGICAAIGLAFVNAAWRWSFGHELPPLPGQTLLMAAVPYCVQIADNLIRSFETKAQLHMGLSPGGLHQHGGAPSTP